MRRVMVGAAALLVLAVTACGSDSGSSNSGGGSDSDDLCAFAQEMERTLNDESLTNTDRESFARIEEIIGNVHDKAPAEIKADVATVAAGFRDVHEIFAEYDYDLAKLTAAAQEDPEVAARLQAFDNEEFNSASDRVDTYMNETCGIGGST